MRLRSRIGLWLFSSADEQDVIGSSAPPKAPQLLPPHLPRT